MRTYNNYIKTLFLLLVLVFTSSCEDFLTTTPTDFISPENFYNTETEADMAIAGVYQSLNELYKDVFKNGFTASTDETVYVYTGSANQMIIKTFDATTPDVYNTWSKLYLGVYRANAFLKNINKLDVDSVKKNAFIAEARFLRGYFYYHLVMLYGDVPHRLQPIESPINTDLARTPREVVFDSVCADMKFATEHLYTYTLQKGAPVRACNEAATGVLARVYLSMAGVLNKPEYYAKALEILLPLVNSQTIKLNPDYTQIWKNISADTYDHVSREIMFDVEFNADLYKYLYGGWASNVAPAAPAGGTYNPNDRFRVTTTFWQYYQSDKNDVRYTWNIADYNYSTLDVKTPKAAYTANGSNATDRNPGKFRRDWEVSLPRDPNKNGANFPILRYSDVLLMLSEAENEVNGPTDVAFAALDSVRSRAKAFKFSDLPVRPTQEELRTIIRDERSRELCFESTTRYYDLIRWGIIFDKFTEVGNTMKLVGGANGANWANKLYYVLKPQHILFPIPQIEMQLNSKMTQNPGY
jgi:hypothetical protein